MESRRAAERRILTEQAASLCVEFSGSGPLGITLRGLAAQAHETGGVVLQSCEASSPAHEMIPIGSRLMFIGDNDYSMSSFSAVIECLQEAARPITVRFAPPQVRPRRPAVTEERAAAAGPGPSTDSPISTAAGLTTQLRNAAATGISLLRVGVSRAWEAVPSWSSAAELEPQERIMNPSEEVSVYVRCPHCSEGLLCAYMDGYCGECGRFFQAASIAEWNFRRQHPTVAGSPGRVVPVPEVAPPLRCPARRTLFQPPQSDPPPPNQHPSPDSSFPFLRIRSLTRVTTLDPASGSSSPSPTVLTSSNPPGGSPSVTVSGSPPAGHPWLANRAMGAALATASSQRSRIGASLGVGYSGRHDAEGNELYGAPRSRTATRSSDVNASVEHARLIEQVLASIRESRSGQQVVVVRHGMGLGARPDTLTYEEAIAIQEQLGGSVPNGLTPSAIDQIPIVPVVGECVCAVCMEDLEEGVGARRLPCEHRFHPQCIDPWLAIKPTCPLCQFRLPRE